MNSKGSYFRIEKINDEIQLCFVDIFLFVEKYVQNMNGESFRRQKSIYFDPEGALKQYFSKSDFKRVNNFKILKKQAEWMAGRVAVKRLAALSLNEKENRIKISVKEGGAPFLHDFPDSRISISHSEQFAVACIGLHKRMVAVDIEKIEAGRMKSIGRVAFSIRELEQLKNKSDDVYYTFWTVKEAFLKYIEKGFAEGLKKVEFLDGDIFHYEKKVAGIIIDSRIIEKDYAFTMIYLA